MLRPYSEFMPPPFAGIKPYAPDPSSRDATDGARPNALEIDEYEQAHDLEPGFDRIAEHVVEQLASLTAGKDHNIPSSLLEDNPAWPPELAAAAARGRLRDDPDVIALALALSRSQDDKGNARWTLYGTSHDGAARAFWHGMDRERLDAFVRWSGVKGDWCVFDESEHLPEALHGDRLRVGDSAAAYAALVTFVPFAQLPANIRQAYLLRELTILPTPASQIFFHHPGYARLASTLPRAQQIPLLHLFPRIEGSCTIRIPQSGFLDETEQSEGVARTHRWQRVERDAGIPDGAYQDKVSIALFSTDPDVLGLYDKPLARNAQIWTADSFEAVLDGPLADRAALEHAAKVVDIGGRFGYRMMYPPMLGGVRSLYWHVPVVARRAGKRWTEQAGYISAERAGHPALTLEPALLDRPAHRAAARKFERDPGRPRHTTSNNVRKLLEAHQLLDRVPESFARALLRVAKTTTLQEFLAEVKPVAPALRECLEIEARVDDNAIVIDALGTREFEVAIWKSIAGLAEGEFRQKENADAIPVNAGRTGGPAAELAKLVAKEQRDLEALGDHLHARYHALIEAAGMQGRAEVVDHVFRWETDFQYPWMTGWVKNQEAPCERNIVCVIPGKRRDEAVIMGDHYDTAYMEDVYDADRGGDKLRAPAFGADDNHSATTALLLAAEHFLALSKAGRLERDIWLVHLTGEEFPADSLGARAICEGLVQRTLTFTAEDGSTRDVGNVRVVGAYILDMVGHNTERDRDVFQISPGEGEAAMRLALAAHRANEQWNRLAARWNSEDPARHDAGRAVRMPDGSEPPPLFSHLELHGEVRVEWEPASSLFNTDCQAFSDIGVPVVLFMENYDISRTGYHDTLDNMANIDLDYCAAITAIAIESVAQIACAPKLDASLLAR